MTNSRPVEWIRTVPDEYPGEGIEHRRTVLAPSPTDHDPFILWGEDSFRRGAFDWHAHRGFETVSYILDGALEHSDSLGNEGVLHAGNILWTTAGSGLFHDAQPVGDSVARGMQLWLNLPADRKMVDPGERTYYGDEVPSFGTSTFRGRVFAGTCNGVTGPAKSYAKVTFVELKFSAGSQKISFPEDQVGTLYVLSGSLEVDGNSLTEGQAIGWGASLGSSGLTAKRPGVALLIAGKPLGEPVVVDGPFVMNTKAEIAQAYDDLAAGKLGAAPPKSSAERPLLDNL